jgi:hypothetical protein
MYTDNGLGSFGTDVPRILLATVIGAVIITLIALMYSPSKDYLLHYNNDTNKIGTTINKLGEPMSNSNIW